jgi:hypothetical protein
MADRGLLRTITNSGNARGRPVDEQYEGIVDVGGLVASMRPSAVTQVLPGEFLSTKSARKGERGSRG